MQSSKTVNDHVELSPEQARKIVLLSQRIQKKNPFGSGKNGVLRALEHLGYVQLDSISVVQRAHHHSLWNRVDNYQPQFIDQLLEDKQIFEYWTHAAAYLPMKDYRYSLPRKHGIAGGEKHWFEKDSKITNHILQRITSEGPLQARDFEQKNQRNNGWWDWKPAKKALEQLFMEGELMVVNRLGFQKVYDLTERVLPTDIDTSIPSTTEYCRHLISRFIFANGVAKPEQIGYLRTNSLTSIRKHCQQMQKNGELIQVKVGRQTYYAMPQIEKLLKQKISRSRVKILSPFDNVLIQRKRTKEIFNFDYRLECYLPAPNRQFGYFCLPLLWGQRFAGRMDVKMDRKTGILGVAHLHVETRKVEEFIQALQLSLVEFMSFNQGDRLQVDTISCHKGSHSRASVNHFKQVLTW